MKSLSLSSCAIHISAKTKPSHPNIRDWTGDSADFSPRMRNTLVGFTKQYCYCGICRYQPLIPLTCQDSSVGGAKERNQNGRLSAARGQSHTKKVINCLVASFSQLSLSLWSKLPKYQFGIIQENVQMNNINRIKK